MLIRVLGSAAGGGFPQWNCGCDNCVEARRAAPAARVRPRTQESVAVSADGESWFLINCSPEIRAQVEGFAGLWPRARRHSPIAGILLTNGDLDHCLGLLSLRESHPLVVYATDAVRAGFTEGNVLYRTLARFPEQVDLAAAARWVSRRSLGDAAASGLRVTAIAAPGKLPLHLEASRAPSPEDDIGLVIRDPRTGGRLAYFSGVAGPSADIARAVEGAGAVFFDGTFWSSDELIAAGLGTRRAEDMAHWPVGGPDGSLGFLARAGAAAAHPDPHQQHQPDPARGRPRAPRGRRGRRRGRRGRHGADAVNAPPRRSARAAAVARRARGAAARRRGRARYHDQHPFHQRMHAGQLTRAELQPWTLNRYYYQTRIPIKDAIIVSKSEDPAFRRAWIRRIHDHDGDGRRARAASRCGCGWPRRSGSTARGSPPAATSCPACASPATPTSRLCRDSPLVVAVASSLTEMFAPDLMSRRIASWEQHYPWVGAEALAYFRARVPRARRDGDEALAFVVAHADSRALQEACVAALVRKTEILWHLLDCVAAGARAQTRARVRAAGRPRRDRTRDPGASGAQGAAAPRSALGQDDAALPRARPRAQRDGRRDRGAVQRRPDRGRDRRRAVRALCGPGRRVRARIEDEVGAFLRTLDERGLLVAADEAAP